MIGKCDKRHIKNQEKGLNAKRKQNCESTLENMIEYLKLKLIIGKEDRMLNVLNSSTVSAMHNMFRMSDDALMCAISPHLSVGNEIYFVWK